MTKETNFDISLTRTEALYLLNPDKGEQSISENITLISCARSTEMTMTG